MLQRINVQAEAKVQHIMLCPQVFFDFEDKHFCRLGTDIFMAEDVKEDNTTKIQNMLNADSPVLRKSTKDAFLKALDFTFVDEMVSPMLMLYFGFSVWSDFLEKAGHPQRFVLYVQGETGIL